MANWLDYILSGQVGGFRDNMSGQTQYVSEEDRLKALQAQAQQQGAPSMTPAALAQYSSATMPQQNGVATLPVSGPVSRTGQPMTQFMTGGGNPRVHYTPQQQAPVQVPAIPRSRSGQPMVSVPAPAQPQSDETTPPDTQVNPFFLQNGGDDMMDTPAPSDEGTPVQTNVDPQAQAIEDIKRQKAMIDAIYPQAPSGNVPAQTDADAYADNDLSRTKALAQLALFSGITQGAGGDWVGVGKGLAAAGQTYSAGFDRYQKALQAKADRATAQQKGDYQNQVSRTDAAVKLYGQQQSLAKDRDTQARQAIKDRVNMINDYFGKQLDALKGDTLNPGNPEKIQNTIDTWRKALEPYSGTDLSPVSDVSDSGNKS